MTLSDYLDELMQGDFVPLSDETVPPWVEVGVITEVAPWFFDGLCREYVVQQSLYFPGLPAAHISKPESGGFVLLWEEDGIRCARGLSIEELAEFDTLRAMESEEACS